MRILSLILALLLAPHAHADLGAAQQAYREGRWGDAASLAENAGGAEGYAFAAGALIAQLMVEPENPDREALADQALDLARQAYRLDEASVSARLRLASSLGFRGRFMSGIGAYMRHIPQRGRNLIESVVEEQPDNAWAVGMLGAWHLEVARRGGDRGLSALDASVEAGIGFYSQAIAMDEFNPATRFYFALSLLALDEDAYRPRAAEQLAIVVQLQARDAFEAGIIQEAILLGSLLSDPDAASAWADARLGQ